MLTLRGSLTAGARGASTPRRSPAEQRRCLHAGGRLAAGGRAAVRAPGRALDDRRRADRAPARAARALPRGQRRRSARGCATCCASTAPSTSPTCRRREACVLRPGAEPAPCEQLQARAVGVAGGDEPRGRRAEHELEHLAALAAHLQAPCPRRARPAPSRLEAAAEVGDARRAPTRGTGREGPSMRRCR